MNLKEHYKRKLMEVLVDDPIEIEYNPPKRPPVGAQPTFPPGEQYDDPTINPFDPSTYPLPIPISQPPFPGPVPTTPNMIRPVRTPIDPPGPPSNPNKPGWWGVPVEDRYTPSGYNPFALPTWIPPTVEQPQGSDPPFRPDAGGPGRPPKPAPVPVPSPNPYPPMGPNYYRPFERNPNPPATIPWYLRPFNL